VSDSFRTRNRHCRFAKKRKKFQTPVAGLLFVLGFVFNPIVVFRLNVLMNNSRSGTVRPSEMSEFNTVF